MITLLAIALAACQAPEGTSSAQPEGCVEPPQIDLLLPLVPDSDGVYQLDLHHDPDTSWNLEALVPVMVRGASDLVLVSGGLVEPDIFDGRHATISGLNDETERTGELVVVALGEGTELQASFPVTVSLPRDGVREDTGP